MHKFFTCTRLLLLVVDKAHGQRCEHAKDQENHHEEGHVLQDAVVLDAEDLLDVAFDWDLAHTHRCVLQQLASDRVARDVE